MREDICSIPISELFEPKKGCPICRMDAMLESRLAEYITGAAMMEPDVRIETNRLGFCSHHFDRICEVGSRLSIALILESHLKEVEERAFSAKAAPKKKKLFGGAAAPEKETCFICENMEKNRNHLVDSLLNLWGKEEDTRSRVAGCSRSRSACACITRICWRMPRPACRRKRRSPSAPRCGGCRSPTCRQWRLT